MKIKNKPFWLGIIIIMILLLGYFIYQKNANIKETLITYNQFRQMVIDKKITEVYLTESPKIRVKSINGMILITDNPRKLNFKEELLQQDIKVNEEDTNIEIIKVIQIILPICITIALIYYLSHNTSRQAQKGISKISSIQLQKHDSKNVTFDHIAGNIEAKESVKELVDFIKNPDKYAKYGARMPRGILLYGPPGTGKTLMAKALAGEAKVPFYAVSGSDFVQVYVGVGAGRIRDIFSKAKQHGRCVIFIDEIDALGKKRDHNASSGNEERDQTLNALLTEMSGFSDNEGIIVIAATNRLDMLDEALLRPGRFDRHIEIGLPDLNARLEIIKYHSKNKLISNDIDFKKIAMNTVYFSGAKLESMMNEAAILAASRQAKCIELCDIDKAYYTVVAGFEKKDRSLFTKKDKEITAYHEAGHALITKLIAPENHVTKITIIPSTKGVGGFSTNIRADQMYYTKRELENYIRIALSGRAAEELKFGNENITSGAFNDIEKATEYIITMLRQLGMNQITGLLNYDILYKNDIRFNYDLIVVEARKLMEQYYNDTKSLLQDNWDRVTLVSDFLIQNESMDEDELEKVIA